MKFELNKNKWLVAVFWLSALLVMPLTLHAQEAENINANFKVIFHNKHTGEDEQGKVRYSFYANIDKAKEVKAKLERVISNSGNDPMKLVSNIEKVRREYKISRESKGNGRFSLNIMSGMAVVILAEEDGLVAIREIQRGQTEYEVRFDVQRLKGAQATGQRKLKPRTTIVETDNGMEQFRIQIPIDRDYVKESSRLILQTYAVDCLTEDTVDYCCPLVYEEEEYHDLQDKRMCFDYEKNDKLAKSYVAGGIPGFIDTTIVYEKPDKRRSYKGPTRYAIEDYHHVCFESVVGGSCLRIRPFKFLDFSVAIPEMTLTEEFKEIADIVTDNKQTDLNLVFVQGKDILTDDSINDVERRRLIKELEAYGSDLTNPVIIGTSSPEGSEKTNMELAKKRANVAKGFISPYLPRKVQPSVQTRIYTWEDVAAELMRIRRPDEANAVTEAIAANGSNKGGLDAAIRALPFYETSVVPIINRMRMMKFTYQVIVQHVMEPHEAVAAYYKKKHIYLEGKEKLSSGDYYNIYATMEDSLELDTLTMMAYNWLKEKPIDALYGEKIAPYVYYKMARLKQRNGEPDTLLLKPLIDDSLGIDINKNMYGEAFKMNRQDIIVAQAMNYYQLQKFAKAQEYISWLKDYGKTPVGLDKLEMFMNLKNYYGNDEQNPDFIKAKEYVLNSSPENKAILLTETPDWRVSFEDTDDLINRMEDSNPKKWYLKGVLWKEKAETQPSLDEFYPEEENSFKILTQAEENTLMMKNYSAFEEYEKKKKEYLEAHKNEAEKEPVNISGIRHYLAYFHHSFQISPSFKGLYYNEGHVDEDLRKKYKYLKKDFAGYEEVFKLLKERDDRRRRELMPEEYEDEGGSEATEASEAADANAGGNETTDASAGGSEAKDANANETKNENGNAK